MDNKVFYGEYSIAYWLELILTKKILLPSYQRHFVWKEENLSNLIMTFKEKRFVPPITLGAFKFEDGRKCNYIIDGQQRLTSLLLAYLGIFPDKEKYKARLKALANGDEQPIDDGEDPFDNVLEWTFTMLTDKGKSKSEIVSKIEPGNYRPIDLKVDDEFFENTFLGFSYIVPLAEGEESLGLLSDNELEDIVSSTNLCMKNFCAQRLVKGWLRRQYNEYMQLFGNCGKECLMSHTRKGFDFFAHCDNCGKKRKAHGKQVCGNYSLKQVYESVFKHRNRCAHNTRSHEQNLPSLDILQRKDYILENYFIRFAMLIIIDKLFVALFDKYLTVSLDKFRL